VVHLSGVFLYIILLDSSGGTIKTRSMTLEQVIVLCDKIEMSCLGNKSFSLRVEKDVKRPDDGRVFIQVIYRAPCVKTGEDKVWTGRKFYLSDHMTQDEVVKTAYLAFELAVKHEIMEGFLVGGKTLFNPHVDFTELLAISQREVTRD
jgi:hypothetical protein